jgi:hypothetical protein
MLHTYLKKSDSSELYATGSRVATVHPLLDPERDALERALGEGWKMKGIDD